MKKVSIEIQNIRAKMDEFNKCENKFCKKESINSNKRIKNVKPYKCSKKEKLTKINQWKFEIPIPLLGSNRIPKTLCEKKSWAQSRKNISKENDMYIKPWQKCLKKHHCKL